MSDLPILAALAARRGAVMKPPFALVGAGFLVEEVREKRWKDAIKIGVVLGLPALEILGVQLLGTSKRAGVQLSLVISVSQTGRYVARLPRGRAALCAMDNLRIPRVRVAFFVGSRGLATGAHDGACRCFCI